MRLFIKINIFWILMMSLGVAAQEQPVSSQYLMNHAFINPAVTGIDRCFIVQATHRQQWIGMPGAPGVQTLSAEGSLPQPFRYNQYSQHSAGGYIYRSKNGDYRNIGLQGDYAFSVLLNKQKGTRLSFGLGIKAYQHALNLGRSNVGFDPAISGAGETVIRPEASTGAFLYSRKYFMGLSGVDLLGLTPNSSNIALPGGRHFYLEGGYRIYNQRNTLFFEPSVLFKINSVPLKQVDLNFRVVNPGKFFAGLSYRRHLDDLPGSGVSLIPMANIYLKRINIMYALDLNLTPMQRFNYGTHEIMVGWRICRDEVTCAAYR